ncbi:MAG: hypothetical protein KGY46_10225, partial [Anaerolineales bacterium]|nr:hypothetical protein [Anaerolineales bacterium]
MDIDSAWSQFKEHIRFEMPSKAFKDYVDPVTYLGMEENRIRLSVPDERAAAWIRARLQAEILNHYQGHVPDIDGQLSLELVVKEGNEKEEAPGAKAQGGGEEKEQVEANAAWRSLLDSLQGTPLELPSSWEEETSARWDAGGECLIASVPPSADSQWLEKKFLPVAEIFFAQDHQQKTLLLEQRGGTGYADLLVKVQRGAYEEIVQPQKIVPVQIYMFHHWLPVLSASPFWVVVAMRQISFVNQAQDNCVTKPVSSRNLARWAPMRHVQVIDWLNKGGFSGWFFEKTKDSFEDHPPEYQVWSKIPVAPHHLAWIETFFREHAEEESAVSLLEAALDRTGEIRRTKPGDVDLPGSYQEKRRTLVDVVSDVFPGQLTQHVYDLITQLENQIVRPNLSITIPHYFFRKYMEELTANEAAFIWYLRSLYRENSDDTLCFEGFQPLESGL